MEKPILDLTISNLKIAYNKQTALAIGSLKLEANTLAIIGHNGSGKSTLIKSILDLMTTEKGSVEASIDSKRIFADRDMAYSPESGSVFADVTVKEYLKFWSALKLNNKHAYKSEFLELIEALEMEPLMKKLGRELSKGQRRRVQTFVGFLCKPKLFLLDEPFDGLDVIQTNTLIELIATKSTQMNFVISSHRMEVVEKLSDSVILLDQGKVAFAGKVKEVIKQMSGKDCSLIDAMNNYLHSER